MAGDDNRARVGNDGLDARDVDARGAAATSLVIELIEKGAKLAKNAKEEKKKVLSLSLGDFGVLGVLCD